MKRIEFLKKSIISGVAAMAAPLMLKSSNGKTSTFNKLMEQVGFNHMPNNEVRFCTKLIHAVVPTTDGSRSIIRLVLPTIEIHNG